MLINARSHLPSVVDSAPLINVSHSSSDSTPSSTTAHRLSYAVRIPPFLKSMSVRVRLGAGPDRKSLDRDDEAIVANFQNIVNKD